MITGTYKFPYQGAIDADGHILSRRICGNAISIRSSVIMPFAYGLAQMD